MVSRMGGTYVFPANFMLVAAMNPCPCGYYPNRQKCRCTEPQIRRYQGRLSGPILDRFDISVPAETLPVDIFRNGKCGENSQQIRERVIRARKRQWERAKDFHFSENSSNADVPAGKLDQVCKLRQEEKDFLEKVLSRLEISARGYHRILRVARTIADLDESETVEMGHLKEAIGLRIDSAGRYF